MLLSSLNADGFAWCKINNLTADEPICVCRRTYIRGLPQPAASCKDIIWKGGCQEFWGKLCKDLSHVYETCCL